MLPKLQIPAQNAPEEVDPLTDVVRAAVCRLCNSTPSGPGQLLLEWWRCFGLQGGVPHCVFCVFCGMICTPTASEQSYTQTSHYVCSQCFICERRAIYYGLMCSSDKLEQSPQSPALFVCICDPMVCTSIRVKCSISCKVSQALTQGQGVRIWTRKMGWLLQCDPSLKVRI